MDKFKSHVPSFKRMNKFCAAMLLVNQKETILDVRYGSCPAVPKYVNPECFKSILQFSDFCTVLWA